ncbi:5-hydroxytryptamine receptor 3A-like [Rana temporaria]|uniref:5-hydroxytryptamine receptor 3A-like n=1 Tax=Rana temporaria TaxID=8407 RepID=UPI001AAC9D49|nr:5-hydroxytryptamine receptor 3A-like [Rana temporaria]
MEAGPGDRQWSAISRQQEINSAGGINPRSRSGLVTARQSSTEIADKDKSSKQAIVRIIKSGWRQVLGEAILYTGIYYVMCMGLLMISLIESIFIVRMVHQHNVHAEVPKWLKQLVLEKLISVPGIQNKMFEELRNKPSYEPQELETDGIVQESRELLTNKSAMMELSQYLMDGYNKDVRPVKNWRKPITVYIKIAIYAILGVDEKNQLLKSYIWYNQSWVDEFLQWDPTKFDNLTRFSIPTQSIWLPDIMIEEAVSSEDSPAVPYVYVNYHGRVMNNIPIHITTACTLDVYYFPFDVANCSMSFSSWLHTAQDINISFARMPHESHNIINAHVTEGEWDLLEVVRDYKESTDPDRVFGEITFYIILKRKPLFYVVNVIFPSTILMIMDTIGFFIPPESGERISFKITLLLGYSVFLVIASETLPAIGAPLIGIYFLVCMLLLMISLAESIFIVRICHKKSLFLQVPGWLKQMALGKMAQVLLIKDKISASCSIKRGTSGNTEEINIASSHVSYVAQQYYPEPSSVITALSLIITL